MTQEFYQNFTEFSKINFDLVAFDETSKPPIDLAALTSIYEEEEEALGDLLLDGLKEEEIQDAIDNQLQNRPFQS